MNFAPPLELHVFDSGENDSVVFHPVAKIFFRASRFAGSVLAASTQGESAQSIAARLGLTVEQVEGLLTAVETQVQSKLNSVPTSVRARVCGKLSFHLSNDCNMRCRYCYAAGGAYGLDRGFMSPKTAVEILDRFYRRFDEINEIMFFGGEPLLNFPAMKATCEFLAERSALDPTKSMPALGIVTNLGAIPKGFPELVNRYRVGVTASLDGPPEVHDVNRQFLSGRGTHQAVSRNIRRMRELTGQPTMIEATYTRQHVERGISLRDLSDYFQREFGVRNAEIADVSVPDEHPCRLPERYWVQLTEQQDQAVEDLLEALVESPDAASVNYFYCTLGFLLSDAREFDFHCNAGIQQYAVATNGDLYPCHMFVGTDAFRMSNIFDEDPFHDSSFERVRSDLLSRAKSSSHCSKCWARNLCLGCVARCYHETGSSDFAARADCDRIRASLERMLAKLAEIHASPERWKSFLANFRRHTVGSNVEAPC